MSLLTGSWVSLSCGSVDRDGTLAVLSPPGNCRRLVSCILWGLSVCWPSKRQSYNITSSPLQHGSICCFLVTCSCVVTTLIKRDDTAPVHNTCLGIM